MSITTTRPIIKINKPLYPGLTKEKLENAIEEVFYKEEFYEGQDLNLDNNSIEVIKDQGICTFNWMFAHWYISDERIAVVMAQLDGLEYTATAYVDGDGMISEMEEFEIAKIELEY